MNAEVRPGYKQTEVGVIPQDWEVKRLRDISPSQTVGLVINPSSYFDEAGTIPMLVGSHVSENSISWQTANKITEKSNNQVSASRLYANDLVMVRVGEPGVTAVVPPELDGCNCASMMIIRQGRAFDSTWLCYVMNSDIGRKQVENVQYGTAQKQFNISDAVNFVYPTPPFAEQKAIASALSGVESVITSLDQLIAKKRDIQQAAMQQLLTGQRRLPGFSGEWEVKRLGDVASLSRINVIPSATPDKTFTHFSLPAFDEGKRPVKESGATIGSNKFSVPIDAILVSKLNPRIPRVWLPKNIPTNAVASTEFLVLTPRDGVVREFLYVTCKSSSFCAQMELSATGTTGSHQRISPTSTLGLLVNVPSDNSEQTAIATILSDMDTELAALEARRDKASQLKQGMMQELLTGRVRLA
ncbi:restriction endonuclease subunit S [Pseudomonas sp. TCU-HL1]|uniref:restriction endonuclease subunit S n=1 Tax=Pseudomonas sp. TCU-HL1 TaxID=1856685 RepID=UPI000856435F|nr:restriction endonuclease subunit S [Pseudomonas sp. TCU-HL1]AOE86310.1 restriction modification system DNA specificity subunit [Pseudomonas sp. TCU-HL1]